MFPIGDTKFGLVLRMAHDDPQLAPSVGVSATSAISAVAPLGKAITEFGLELFQFFGCQLRRVGVTARKVGELSFNGHACQVRPLMNVMPPQDILRPDAGAWQQWWRCRWWRQRRRRQRGRGPVEQMSMIGRCTTRRPRRIATMVIHK